MDEFSTIIKLRGLPGGEIKKKTGRHVQFRADAERNIKIDVIKKSCNIKTEPDTKKTDTEFFHLVVDTLYFNLLQEQSERK